MMNRWMAALLAVMLLAAACGSGDESTEDTGASSSSSVPADAAASEPADDAEAAQEETTDEGGPEEPEPAATAADVAVDVQDAIDTMRRSIASAVDDHLAALSGGAGDDPAPSLESSAVLWRASRDAYGSLSQALADLPRPEAIGADLDAYRSAVDDYVVSIDAVLATLDSDFDAAVQELEAANADDTNESGPFGTLLDATDTAGRAEEAACFGLSDAIANAGGAFSCTAEVATESVTDDPTLQTTGGSEVTLAPGSYDFALLDRPFSIDLAESIDVRTSADVVEFISTENNEFYFYVVAVEEFVDPASELLPNTIDGTVAIEADLTPWAEALPISGLTNGTAALGNRDFAWWDFTSHIPVEGAESIVFAFVETPEHWVKNLQIFDVGFNRIWLLDTPSGWVMVFAHSVIWSGIPHEDLVAWVEQVLATATFE